LSHTKDDLLANTLAQTHQRPTTANDGQQGPTTATNLGVFVALSISPPAVAVAVALDQLWHNRSTHVC